MHITILGGGGFLGRKLAERLAKDGSVGGRAVASLTLFDLAQPKPLAASFPVRCLGGDVTSATDLAAAIPPETDAVVHLAAVVSAAAEADLDLGLKVNVQGTLAVLNACRALPKAPRVIFTSSVASFGGGQDANLPDEARQIPGNSYGAQKAIGELLLQDATRRGLMDAISIRLPTVVVRPGRPNKAASSFFSGILREPLLGLESECPVGDGFKVWVCSPRRAVEWFLQMLVMDTAPLGVDRGVNPPGLCVTVGEMLAALQAVGGPAARALVKRVPDASVEAIVGGWPASFTADRARKLGFSPHESLEEVVRNFVADDLAATKADRGV